MQPVLEDQDDRIQWAAASVAAAVDSVDNLALLPHPDEYKSVQIDLCLTLKLAVTFCVTFCIINVYLYLNR